MRWRLEIDTVDRKGRPYLYPYVMTLATEDAEEISYDERRAVCVWCFGEFGHETERWRASGWDFKFRDHNDALSFKMRWG